MSERQAGPLSGTDELPVNDGTMCLAPTPAPGPICDASGSYLLAQALREVEAEAETFSLTLIGDSVLRSPYAASIRSMSQEILRKVQSGEMSLAEAVEAAHGMRNSIMEATRRMSSPVGRAYAEQLKATGRSMESLLQKKAAQLFKKDCVTIGVFVGGALGALGVDLAFTHFWH